MVVLTAMLALASAHRCECAILFFRCCFGSSPIPKYSQPRCRADRHALKTRSLLVPLGASAPAPAPAGADVSDNDDDDDEDDDMPSLIPLGSFSAGRKVAIQGLRYVGFLGGFREARFWQYMVIDAGSHNAPDTSTQRTRGDDRRLR